jgi:hypothetical protein
MTTTKTHDWRPVTGIVHPYRGAAEQDVAEARLDARPDVRFRVLYIATGYLAQARVWRAWAQVEAHPWRRS